MGCAGRRRRRRVERDAAESQDRHRGGVPGVSRRIVWPYQLGKKPPRRAEFHQLPREVFARFTRSRNVLVDAVVERRAREALYGPLRRSGRVRRR